MLMAPATAAAQGEQASPAESFSQAQQAYDAGHFDEAAVLFARLARAQPHKAGLQFWWAYAAYRAGDLGQAASAAERALALTPDSPDSLYLAGVVAFDRGQLDAAQLLFDRLAPQGDDTPLALAAREHLELIQWQRALEQAKKTLEAGSLDEAERQLDGLLKRRPGEPAAVYHRALARYRRGDHEAALAGFDEVLSSEPSDTWAAYMRALCLQRLDRPGEARAILTTLADSADQTVAAEARAASQALERAGADPPDGRHSGSSPRIWRGRLATGLAWDSNPAFVSDSSYVDEADQGWGPTLEARGELALPLPGEATLTAAPRGLVRSYPLGPSGYDLALASLRLELQQSGGGPDRWLGLGAGGSLLGWAPLLDVQEAWLGVGWHRAERWRGSLQLSGFRREAHLQSYENLDALGTALAPRLRVLLHPRLTVTVGWPLRLERADAYTLDWSGATAEPEALTYDASLEADASFLGQGPELALSWRPHWRDARLDANAGLQWRRYTAEEVSYTFLDEVQRYQLPRGDRRARLRATASARAWGATRGFVSLSWIANHSTIEGDSWPVDRNFTSLLAAGGLELRR